MATIALLAGCSNSVEGAAVAAGQSQGAPGVGGAGTPIPTTAPTSVPRTRTPSTTAPMTAPPGAGSGMARPASATVPSCAQIQTLAGSSLQGFRPAGQDIVTAKRQTCRFTTGMLSDGGKNVNVSVSENPFSVELLQKMLASSSAMGDNAIEDPRLTKLGVLGQQLNTSAGTVVTLMLAGRTVTVMALGSQSGTADQMLDAAVPVAAALLK